MPPRPLTNLRKLCLAFPESHEVEAWGEPTFRVRNKLFAMYASPNTHHGSGRPAVGGWIGVWLDRGVRWAEVAELLQDAYSLVAPKRLREQLQQA